MRTIIVDADVLVYQAASAAQRPIEWTPDVWTVHGDVGTGQRILDERLAAVCAALNADRLVLALTDDANWRKEVMPTYKQNRAKNAKPILMQPLRAYCHERYEVFQRPTLEGDDVMGILGTHPTLLPGQKVLVTIDKDLQGIPGYLVNLADCQAGDYDGAIRHVTEAEADRFHLVQTLSGDPTDGYPGCPKIGPKTALKVLEDTTGAEAWSRIVAAYEKAGLNEAVALTNARVARILRFREYDYINKRVIHWSPPTA